MITWGNWYWPWWLGASVASFLAVEIYALVSKGTDNTLSNWVWHQLHATAREAMSQWTAAHFLFVHLDHPVGSSDLRDRVRAARPPQGNPVSVDQVFPDAPSVLRHHAVVGVIDQRNPACGLLAAQGYRHHVAAPKSSGQAPGGLPPRRGTHLPFYLVKPAMAVFLVTDAMMGTMDDASDLSCPECGAMVAADRRDFHLEWHARVNAALTELAARQDGIPPRRGDHG